MSYRRFHRQARLLGVPLLPLLPLLAPAARSAEPAATAVDRTHCTVLLYHKFDEPEHASTNISSGEFREQLRYLRDSGYTVLSMDAFAHHLDSGTPFPERSVLITIDDAYRSVDSVARPLLKQFGYPWTLFAWTKGIEDGYPDLMSWADIERLAAGGVTVANHTSTHAYLALPGRHEGRDEYVARVAGEIHSAQRLLRAHGIENPHFAFPYGYYNNVVIDIARTAGYRFMFTQDPGGVDTRTPPERIPRAALVGAEQDMKDFAYRLSLSPLHVTDIHPPPGVLEKNPPERFGVRLLDPGRYRPGQVNMFISEWGRVDAVYNPDTGDLRFTAKRRLTRKMNRMIVTARDRETGTFSMYSEMLVRPFPELTTAAR